MFHINNYLFSFLLRQTKIQKAYFGDSDLFFINKVILTFKN